MSYRAICTLDFRANENALASKHTRTRLAVVFGARGRVAIETFFATRAVVTGSIIQAQAPARVWVALICVVIAFATNAPVKKHSRGWLIESLLQGMLRHVKIL